MKLATLVFGLAVAVGACGGTATMDAPGSGTNDAGTGSPTAEDFTGTWKGYVENYTFDDGTDAVLMTLDSVTPVAGHVQVGDRALYAPATDPDAGYPPGVERPTNGPMPELLSGFAYTIQDGTFDGERLKFHLSVDEIWSRWCGLQTPIADTTNIGSYNCIPNWASGGEPNCYLQDPNTREKVPIDCMKFELCGVDGACRCTAKACAVDPQGPVVTFDMQLALPRGDGSVADLYWTTPPSVYNVHLKKQ